MKKIGVLVFDNGKFLCVRDKLWDNGPDNFWCIPEALICDDSEADSFAHKLLLSKTGLTGKCVKILCKNTIWDNEETVFLMEVKDFSTLKNGEWKYFNELSSEEQLWLFSKGFLGAIEDWRLDKIRILYEYRKNNPLCKKGSIVFAGSSLQENFPIERFVKEKFGDAITVYNRGIGGYTTREMLGVLDIVNDLKPGAVFLNIGTNDLSNPDISLEQLMHNYKKIVDSFVCNNDGVKIYVMAYYPGNIDVADEGMKECLKIRTNEKIARANKLLKEYASKMGYEFLDLNFAISQDDGKLKPEYCVEGLHVNEDGYKAIFPHLLPYIEEAWEWCNKKSD